MADGSSFGQGLPSGGGSPWEGWWQASDGNWYPPRWPPVHPGAAWGPGLSPSDERTWAMLSHLTHFFGGWIAQLIIMCTKGRESRFVRDQAVEALNFSITVAIAAVVSAVLCLVLIGFLLLFGLVVVATVFPIMGAVRANRGELYRYPICIRFVH